MNTTVKQRLPLPPFTKETALQKIQLAEDAWNSKDPVRVAEAYTINSEWRNRNQFINGREEIVKFLSNKWQNELNYKLKKEYWAHTGNRIAVRFEYEYQNKEGNGLEHTETKTGSLMRTDIWLNGLPVSTIWKLMKQKGNYKP